ncbi:hypothetical protein RHMOL_Rhmol08G0177700 [Rhododendron molle]|uniref:Uncharacterized protein n=1 Tax=Rhododendron molle TaxID=49168 RepID=A0ACC0MQ82_RHOML|nr:hypothetical protein RHMOL_Rhmol08G0177700 [Rhododendron molle]
MDYNTLIWIELVENQNLDFGEDNFGFFDQDNFDFFDLGTLGPNWKMSGDAWGVCRSRENKAAMAACGEKRDGVSISVSDTVVCPKPRRIGILNPSLNEQSRPSRWHANYQTEISDSKAGMELLDIILIKGSYNVEKSITQVASSPPFFSGSPPSRASNPLIQDSQFRNKEFSPLSPLSYQAPNLVSSPSSSARKGGSCARVKFGQKPAAVRVEGFDCISRDRRSISAVA